MLLGALGVSQPQIMQDYLLTGQYYSPEEEFEWFCIRYELDLDFEVIKPVLMVDESYLGNAFETIKTEYGNLDNYLVSIGVGEQEKQALREKFLEH
jgi:Protein tyrosine/serine phosphatase